MGFVTILTKRLELSTCIVEDYVNGQYKLSGNGDELLVAHVAPGDDLKSDPFFRRYFEFSEPDCAE